MTRIAYLTDLLNLVGGAGSNADRICRALHDVTEYDVTAVHAPGTGAPETFWSAEAEYLMQFPKSLDAGLDELDPDLVFVHGYNVGMLDHLRDRAADDDAIYVFRCGVNTMEQWLDLHNSRNPNMVTAPLDHLGFFDGIFAPSHAAAERLKMNYGDDAPPLSVAPCVIESQNYAPTPFMDDGTLRVVTASRISTNNYVLAPLLAVRRLVDEIDVEMEILSAGTQPHLQAVHAIAENLDDVRVVGQIDRDAVRGHLQWADVTCIPTVTQQAVPTVAAEALAAGNVVLAGRFHTTTEESALVRMPVDHPPAWYDAMLDVADDPDAATERIRDGLEAAKTYDVERIVREVYRPTFEMLLAREELDD